MPDHKTVLEELKRSRLRLAHMSKAATPLKPKLDAIAAKFDKIIPGVQKALQLRNGYKLAQTKLAPLKKAVDDQEKKVDDATKKNEDLYKKRVEAAKEVQKWVEIVWKWEDVLKKNKPIFEAVSRIRISGVGILSQKFEYWDDEGYQSRVNFVAGHRKALPKPDSSNKLPPDFGILEGKLDILIKQLQEAATAAKAGKQIEHDLNTKKKALEDLQKKVQPIEDGLAKLMDDIFTNVDEAQTLSSDVAYDKATPEPIKKQFNDISGDLYEARIDYHEVKVKDFAARP